MSSTSSTTHQHLLPLTNPFFFFFFFLLLTYLLLPRLVTPISFNYTTFYCGNITNDPSGGCPEGTHKICLEGDATHEHSDHSIQFTDRKRSSGWAVYSEAVQLWKWESDNTTTAGDDLRKVNTNFTSTYSINLTKNNTDNCHVSAGIAFFLSPYPHRIPPTSGAGMLGLVSLSNRTSASGDGSFVAVEIDAKKDFTWDPSYIHVGIDVNSIESEVVGNLTALSSLADDRVVGEVRVDYESATGNLTATVKHMDRVYAQISYPIDLSGTLPEMAAVGISSTTGYCIEYHKITSWSFDSTWDPIMPARKRKTLVVVWIVVAIVGLALLLGAIYLVSRARRARRVTVREVEVDDEENGEAVMIAEEFADTVGPRRLSYGDIVTATGNFDEKRKLGAGASGAVYRGFLRELNREAAIKRVSSRGDSKRIRKEYMAEVKAISWLRHRNLVQLVGWCHHRGEFLLAYEYMPNLSLDCHLYGNGGGAILTWPVRYNIALGVASALLYLHEGGDRCVVHRDVKSSNVMLDENFNAKLGDFGLARLTEHGSKLRTTMLGGTLGYMAPECFHTGNSSTESDVYAFGNVALEIATGRTPLGDKGDQVRLVPWVWDLFAKGTTLKAADKRLDVDSVDHKSQMERLLVVGLWCAHPDAQRRPSIRKAMAALNFEDVKIDVPKQMPTAFYASPTQAIERISSSTPSTGTTSSPLLPSSSHSSGRRNGPRTKDITAYLIPRCEEIFI